MRKAFTSAGLKTFRVDFPRRTASLWQSLNFMRQPFKRLRLLGLLLCLTAGAFAILLTVHASRSSRSLLIVAVKKDVADSVLQLNRSAIRFTVTAASGEAPNSAQPNWDEIRVSHTPAGAALTFPAGTRIHAPKVSLQILELVLLL